MRPNANGGHGRIAYACGRIARVRADVLHGGHNVRTSCVCTQTRMGDVGTLVVGRDACACGWTPYADLMDTDEYKQKKYLLCVCRRARMGDVDVLRVRADGLRMQNW